MHGDYNCSVCNYFAQTLKYVNKPAEISSEHSILKRSRFQWVNQQQMLTINYGMPATGFYFRDDWKI